MRPGRLRAIVGVSVALVLIGTASAQAAYAPVGRPGPKLTANPKKLRASVSCHGSRHAKREPVLLLPATTVDSVHNFGWNYENLFENEGIFYCASDQPGKRSTNMDDIQHRGQFITYAIRRMHRLSGRKIAVVGHSQGGMAMRWSLRFWPDTRRKVADVIGFAGTNHGSAAITTVNCADGCSAAFAQQRDDARFIKALNSRRETFKPISYTEVFSRLDEVVTPPSFASSVKGPASRVTNVEVQSICPSDASEHLQLGTNDAVAAALALDALTHKGPAKVARIDPDVCSHPLMPGVDPLTGVLDLAAAAAQLAESTAIYPHSPEPRLRCYTKLHPRACRRHRQVRAGYAAGKAAPDRHVRY